MTYVDDVIAIGHNPMKTMKGIQSHFKFKEDKIEEPNMYLGAGLSKVVTADGTECWAMSSDKYCESAVKNVDEALNLKGLKLPSKCYIPISSGYKPELDATAELKADGVQWYQELIGMLRWAVEIGRVDILYETAIMSRHMALPRQGHLEQVLHIFGYLKCHKKMRIAFDPDHPQLDPNRFKTYEWEDFYRGVKEDIPSNIPKPRGLAM